MKAGVTAGLVVMMFLFSGAATGTPPEQLRVDAFAHGPKDGAEVVATVRNVADLPADDVWIDLRQGRRLLSTQHGGRLAEGQATVFRVPLGADAYTHLTGNGDQVYLLVHKQAGQGMEEIAVPVAAPKTPSKKGLGSTVVTALLSVASLLAGILVTEYLTRGRERARSRLEARRADVERDTPAYRAFVADWQGSIDPGHLGKAFDRLIAEASVPDHVRRLYRETRAHLNDPALGPDIKRTRADLLLQAVEDLTRTPAP